MCFFVLVFGEGCLLCIDRFCGVLGCYLVNGENGFVFIDE